ncbi:MAG: VPLPA-CTERM-specific exosortase XrtD [Bdellovibrionales bacterium]|jgi:exosortase D (VPLPA-CTERM-specific)
MVRYQTVKAGFPTAWLKTASFLAFVLNCTFLFILPFESLLNLGAAWQADEYSHGPLIPLIALLIGWHRLTERQPDIKPSWVGLPVLLFGITLIAISHLSAFEPPAHYGFILTLVGITLATFGKSFTSTITPSFIYLFFAIPLPRLIYVALSAEMQLWSSTLGVFILQLMNVSVFQEGNIIDLGGYKLQVVEACSGLRYLFPLMSFSFLMAFLYNDKMWKRIVLFLSAIPLTIGMNALRIALVGVTVNQWGASMAEGVLHDFEGWVIFSVCVAFLFGEMKLLNLLGKKGSNGEFFRYDYLGLAHGALLAKGKMTLSTLPLITLFISGIAAFILVIGTLDNRQEIIPQRPLFQSFPAQIEGWVGTNEPIDSATLSTLKLDDYLLANYQRDADKVSVNLYMAYYKSQRVGSSIHSPSNCLPGGGWRIEKRSIEPIDLGAQTIPVSRLLIREGQQAMLVYYWFAGRGRILNEQYEAKWYLFVDSIMKHRTDGALVRLTTTIAPQETEQDADRRMQAFLSESYALTQPYVP